MATTNGATAGHVLMDDQGETRIVPQRDPVGGDADGVKLTALQQKRRNQRNIAIGVALAAFVALFYLITIVKLSSGAHH